jgi:hypothetical protein
MECVRRARGHVAHTPARTASSCGSRSPQRGGCHACHLGVGAPPPIRHRAAPRLASSTRRRELRRGRPSRRLARPLRRARNEDRWPPRTVSRRSALALEDAATTKTLRGAGCALQSENKDGASWRRGIGRLLNERRLLRRSVLGGRGLRPPIRTDSRHAGPVESAVLISRGSTSVGEVPTTATK